jgi:D-xylose transport system ATP-binding protein
MKEFGAAGSPLVTLRDICVSFGGVRALDRVSLELYAGEVLALVGHNGAGKSTLAKVLSGACGRDSGTITVGGVEAAIDNPRDARHYGIETIYQTLALADNIDAAANIFLGRELKTAWGTLDDLAMEAQARAVIGRLNPQFARFKDPVKSLSGGQRQSVAIARTILFNAQILIMDEPTAALGPQETAQVGDLIRKLKADGIAILLISHDIHDVFDLADRICAMKNGRVVATARVVDVGKDEVLGMIILGKCPPGALAGPGAVEQSRFDAPTRAPGNTRVGQSD